MKPRDLPSMRWETLFYRNPKWDDRCWVCFDPWRTVLRSCACYHPDPDGDETRAVWGLGPVVRR